MLKYNRIRSYLNPIQKKHNAVLTLVTTSILYPRTSPTIYLSVFVDLRSNPNCRSKGIFSDKKHNGATSTF